MKQALRVVCVLAVCAGFGSAYADDENVEGGGGGGGHWSVQSGKTVGNGDTVVHAQMGFPGISATLLHGIASNIDVGGRFSFNYGYEAVPASIVPGLKFQGIVRFGILERSKFNFGIRAEPGLFLYFYRGYTAVGLAIPVGFDFGLHVSDALMVNLNVEFPMVAQFGDFGFFAIPILFGGGAEYKVDRNLALTANTRFGPFINTRSGGAQFAFNLLFGIAYRF